MSKDIEAKGERKRVSPYDFVQSDRSWWLRVVLPVIVIGGSAFLVYSFVTYRSAKALENEFYGTPQKLDRRIRYKIGASRGGTDGQRAEAIPGGVQE